MRILYIHQYFCTRQGRTGTRSYEFAKYLVGKGHQVTMITSASALSDVTIPKGRWTSRSQVDGIDVIAVRGGYAQAMGTLRRGLSFVQFMLLSTWHACRARHHDVVFATSTPLTAGIPGVLAGWVRRIPFVFEVRDLWPEAPIQMGAIRNPRLIAVLRGLERFLYRRATHIVALSPGMRDGVRDAGTPEAKISVIPNCSDLDLFSPGEASRRVVARHGLEGCFVVTHAGSMGASNGLDVLVEAALRLQRQGHGDVRFVLVGDGSSSESLSLRIRAMGLENIVRTGSMPRTEVAELLRASNVCLVLFRNLPILATNSPNKLFDALAAGRPVVVNSDGWTRQLVEEHGVGRYAQPGSAESLANEIVWLQDHEKDRVRMGKRARKLAESHFDRQHLAAHLETVLATAVQPDRAPAAEEPTPAPIAPSTESSAAVPVARNAPGQEAPSRQEVPVTLGKPGE